MQSESTSCVYTTGMGRFGQMDLERLDVPAPPAAVYGQMCDIVAYALANGTVFRPGQALGVGGPEPLLTEAAVSPFTGRGPADPGTPTSGNRALRTPHSCARPRRVVAASWNGRTTGSIRLVRRLFLSLAITLRTSSGSGLPAWSTNG